VPGVAVPRGVVGLGGGTAVDGVDDPPDGEAGDVDGAVEPADPAPGEVCAIAALVNIADTTSDSRRVDLNEKLVIKASHRESLPVEWDDIP